jgi:hypothetical protein
MSLEKVIYPPWAFFMIRFRNLREGKSPEKLFWAASTSH